jgi:hypothetical protein
MNSTTATGVASPNTLLGHGLTLIAALEGVFLAEPAWSPPTK